MIPEQLVSIAFFLILIQLIRYFDLANLQYVVYIRIIYISSQLLQLLLSGLVLNKIKKKGEKAPKIKVPEPSIPFSNEEPVLNEMTIEEYDSMKTWDLIKQTCFGCVFLLFLHLKFEYIQPLIVQSVLTLKTFFTYPIIKIHLFNFEPVGTLARPFPLPKSPFAAFFQSKDEAEAEPFDGSKENKSDVQKLVDVSSPSSSPAGAASNMHVRVRTRA